VSDEAEQWRFRAAVLGAAQGHSKSYLEMRNLLRGGYRLTADDKQVLDDYRKGKFRRKRGRPKRLFDQAYWRRKTVDRVRELETNPLSRPRDLQQKELTREDAIHLACWEEFARRQIRGQRFEDDEAIDTAFQKLFEQIYTEMRRAKKRAKKRSGPKKLTA
jgi:hypothetical protein